MSTTADYDMVTEALAANKIVSQTSLKITYIVIGTLGMIGNIFVVVVILNYKSMMKQLTNTYILNQSVVDATVAFFLVFTSVFEDDGKYKSGAADEAYCRLWLTKMPLWGFLVSSTYNLVSLTLERYLAVVHPIWHKMKFTRTKVMISIVVAWVIGPAYNMAYMIPTAAILDDGSCTVYSQYPDVTTQRAVGILTIFIQYFLPLGILVVFYTRMALALRRKVGPADLVKKADPMARARKNIIRTLWLVGASFVFCWTWNQIYYLMFNMGVGGDFTSTFYHFTVVMVFCNCCINPFIYAANYEQFQRGMQKLFSRCCPGLVKKCISCRKGDQAAKEISGSIDDHHPDTTVTTKVAPSNSQ